MIGNNRTMNFKLKKLARHAATATGAIALIFTGCSMCSGPFDYDYPSFGGSVQRANANWGRVGSVYSDPGAFGGPSADSNLKPHEAGGLFATGGDSFETMPEPLEPPDLEFQSPDDGFNGSGLRDNGSGTRNDGSEILPEPPSPGPQIPPSPDEETTLRSRVPRLRNQSRQNSRKWR